MRGATMLDMRLASWPPLVALGPTGDDLRVGDHPVRRALDEELDLVRSRVVAGRLARHGSERLGPAMVELKAAGSASALAIEALGVLLSAAESKHVLPLLQPDLSVAQRSDRIGSATTDAPTDVARWLRDLVEDADGVWRSNWLRACAIHAAHARGVLDRMDVLRACTRGLDHR